MKTRDVVARRIYYGRHPTTSRVSILQVLSFLTVVESACSDLASREPASLPERPGPWRRSRVAQMVLLQQLPRERQWRALQPRRWQEL